jgi:hypothetical protein
MQDDTLTAIHEAGHVVARYRHGLQLGSVTIEPDFMAGTLGVARGEEANGSEELGAVEVLVSCAGYAALMAAGFEEAQALMGADQDFEEAQALIDFWQTEDLEVHKVRAVDFMRAPENIKAVRAVADVLLRLRHVDEDHASVLVELADGECTQEEYEQYLVNVAVV